MEEHPDPKREAEKTDEQDHVRDFLSRPQITRISIAVWVFLIGFFLLRLYIYGHVPSDPERAKILIESIFSLAVGIVVAMQAAIYFRQAKALDAQLEETRKLIAQNERFSRINSRAYVFIETAGLEDAISSGKFPLPKIRLKNSGKTPAYRYRTRVEQRFLANEALKRAQNGIMPPMRGLSKRGSGIIGAGQIASVHLERETWSGPDEEKLAVTGEAIFYIWGRIAYFDIFGKEHGSDFSLFARNPRVTSLSWGMFGNVTEDEEKSEGNPN